MDILFVALACLLLALLASILRRAYYDLPLYELKRRAAAGEKFAHAIYPAVAYPSLRGLLGLMLAFFSALGLILLNRHIALVYGLIVASIWLWLVYSWIPNRPVAKVSRYIARLAAPFFIWLFSWSHPALKHLERLQKHYEPTHTQLYEIEDLRRFLRHQARQADNRISARQLMRLGKLVAFEEAQVGHFSRPWKSSMRLVETDTVGPKLLDEMHRSKQTAFAVTKHKNSHQIIGALSRDALSLESEGRVSDFMRTDIESIGRDEPVEAALMRFAHTSTPLLVVLDKENEAIGTLCLSDALDALLVLDDDVQEKEDKAEPQTEASPEITEEEVTE